MQDDVLYERNPNFIFRKIVDETLLIPMHHDVVDMECIYALNPVGAFIWQSLDQPQSQQSLHGIILAEFDADPDVLTADLEQFLLEMTAIGALRKV